MPYDAPASSLAPGSMSCLVDYAISINSGHRQNFDMSWRIHVYVGVENEELALVLNPINYS